MYTIFVNTLLPICICVILPITIVWLITRIKLNSDNKRTDVLIEAIRANKDIDTTEIAKAFGTKNIKNKSPKTIMMRKLQWGLGFSLPGAVVFILINLLYAFNVIVSDDIFTIWLFISLICVAVGTSFLLVYKTMKSTYNTNHDSDKISE